MEASQLDTSGRVECAASFQPIGWCIWSDLDPFTQGYVEALFASAADAPTGRWLSGDVSFVAAFSDLAPETIAAIFADCEATRRGKWMPNTAEVGAAFWKYRQRGWLGRFPPLTPYLGDDGRVYLRESR